MSISIEDDEEKIRIFFRNRRDELKQKSAKLGLLSAGVLRPQTKTIFDVQEQIFEWFADLYENIEKLFLEIRQLHGDFQQYEPIMRHFKEYLVKVEEEKERFK